MQKIERKLETKKGRKRKNYKVENSKRIGEPKRGKHRE